LARENHLRARIGPQRKIKQDYRWINDICYVDSDNQEHTVGVLECLEEKPDANGARKTTRFRWITNFNLKTNRVIALADQGGRIRWKIENEGFNVQKNGGYNLEHAYGRPFGCLVNALLNATRRQGRVSSPWRLRDPSISGLVSFQGT
jgi:hypothetical protein